MCISLRFDKLIILIFLLILPTTSTLAEANHGYLVVSSETGFPHNACLLDYGDGNLKWLGFRPKKPRQPVGPGMIDESNREDLIETYVRFKVDINRLKFAENNARNKYKDKTYRVGIFDCVNMCADIVRDCNLHLKKRGNFIPSEFVKSLVKLNHVESDDSRPFPWKVSPIINNEKVAIQLEKIECIKTETVTGPDKIYMRLFSSSGNITSPAKRISLNDNQSRILKMPIQTVRRGHSIAIQLWDDDFSGKDDLVFDWSVSSLKSGTFAKKQVRGTSAIGSESKYCVTVSITPTK